MTPLDQAIADLKKAHAESTQGEWVGTPYSLSIPDQMHLANFNDGDYVENQNENDAPFCALAHNNLPRLIEAMKVMRDALKAECHCTGERDYDGKEVLCDPCDALARVDAIAGGDHG